MKKRLIFLFAGIILFIDLKAQYPYGTTFVIQDKDGYTNVREKPNGKSKVVGQVHKYEIFRSEEGCEDREISPHGFPWLFISTDNINGYIYKKNIIPICEFPCIPNVYKDSTSIILRNDSIEISVTTSIFNPTLDKQEIKTKEFHGLCEEYINSNFEVYSTVNTLNKIVINYRGKETKIFRREMCSYYYDIRDITSHIGTDGELYIEFCGSGDATSYCTIVVFNNSIIKQEFTTTNCW